MSIIINNAGEKKNRFQFKPVLKYLLLLVILGGITFAIYKFKFQQEETVSEKDTEPIVASNVEEEVSETEMIAEPSAEELRLQDEWLEKIPGELEETEWLIVVDRSEQKDYFFHNRKFFKSYIVSTGSATRYSYDATLPIAVWRIGQKIPYSMGEIYGPKLMYLEIWRGSYFEKTNKALHGTNEPENLGQATSLGCIYHSNEDIIEIYDLIPEGTLVITVE